MTRSELINAIAETLPAEQAERAVVIVFDTIAQALADGRRVELRGFGSFHISVSAPRLVHNPRTGQQYGLSPGGRHPRFRTGKALHERIQR